MKFVVEGAFQGIDTVVIAVRNKHGDAVSEMLWFHDEGLVTEGHATHLIRETPSTSVDGVPVPGWLTGLEPATARITTWCSTN